MRDNLSDPYKGAAMVALEAINIDKVRRIFIETLRARGDDELASQVEGLAAGVASTSDDQAKAIAALAVGRLTDFVIEEITKPGTNPWLAEHLPNPVTGQPTTFQPRGPLETTSDVESVLGRLGLAR